MSDKIYYAVYTTNEKIWIRADACEVNSGCLIFLDFEEDGSKVVTSAFQQGYWKYMYEADPDSGESIADQIPFWKRHARPDYSDGADRKGLPQRQS